MAVLTNERLRSILGATVGSEAGAYVDGLKARGLLPRDEAQTPLNAGAVVIALLAIVSGKSPTEAPREALRIAGFPLAGTTQRSPAHWSPVGCSGERCLSASAAPRGWRDRHRAVSKS
jgi:hypothetical protein